MSDDVEVAKKAMAAKPAPAPIIQNSDFLSMGLTLGNLSAYGRINGGLVKGHIYRLIGKSGTAKTMMAKTILAEAAISPNFSDYELIYDDIERGGVLLSTVKFFGQRLHQRMSPPAREAKTKKPLYTRNTSDFYRRVNARLAKGKKFIWIPDSLDGLNADTETKMSDGKAKMHSNELRKLIEGIQNTGSIIILVQHAKVNMTSMWGGHITTGGASPEFYSTLDIWLSKMDTIKRSLGAKYNNAEEPIGVNIQCHIKKNRINGTDRTFEFPLYYSYGIDDIGSCVNWLVKIGHWSKGADDSEPVEPKKKRKKGIIIAEEFGFEGTETQLIKDIEAKDAKRELMVLVGKVWKEIDDLLAVKRKPRFS